jgi:hypothetical protein
MWLGQQRITDFTGVLTTAETSAPAARVRRGLLMLVVAVCGRTMFINTLNNRDISTLELTSDRSAHTRTTRRAKATSSTVNRRGTTTTTTTTALSSTAIPPVQKRQLTAQLARICGAVRRIDFLRLSMTVISVRSIVVALTLEASVHVFNGPGTEWRIDKAFCRRTRVLVQYSSTSEVLGFFVIFERLSFPHIPWNQRITPRLIAASMFFTNEGTTWLFHKTVRMNIIRKAYFRQSRIFCFGNHDSIAALVHVMLHTKKGSGPMNEHPIVRAHWCKPQILTISVMEKCEQISLQIEDHLTILLVLMKRGYNKSLQVDSRCVRVQFRT